jgi:stearoyl-CoA desaturase (delta-9 desaturase)
MGVTIGYHRLLSHRSFRCPKIVEYFWVVGGYLAFEGSPIWWTAIHRAHHRYTDKPLDPHSPRYGWINAYYGWFFGSQYPDYISPGSQAKDLVKDPIYRFLEQGGNWHRAHLLAMLIGMTFRIILLFWVGWTIALASIAAGLLVQQVPLLLNVACHLPKLGYKNYQTGEDSVNVWWVAMLTAGEGWHNNHHAFPGSARSGFKPFEIDLSWLMIRVMKFFGLVGWLHEESIDSVYE